MESQCPLRSRSHQERATPTESAALGLPQSAVAPTVGEVVTSPAIETWQPLGEVHIPGVGSRAFAQSLGLGLHADCHQGR